MRKTLVLMAFAFGTMSAFGQESGGMTSKKGETILPESGDWAISFDAVPFMNYMGNLFSGAAASNTSPGANWVNPGYMSITGKMFKDEKTAYRGTVRLGMNSGHTTEMIADASVTTPPTYPALPAMKEDKWSWSNHYIGLGAGMEMRRGKTRLQGFYGGEAMIWLSGMKNKFEYGNALNAATPIIVSAATTTDFGATATSTGSNISTDTYGNAARITEDKPGGTFGFGVRGFIGAEYFIFPKISIGAEYGWGIGLASTGATTQTWERVGGGPASVGTQTMDSGKNGGFGLDTDINGGTGSGTGSLKITLHF